MSINCPVCEQELIESGSRGFGLRDFNCSVCGKYSLIGTAIELRGLQPDSIERAALIHAIRRMQRQNEWPDLTLEDIQRIVRKPRLPGVAEQSNNLILWLGGNLKGPG